MARRRKQIQHHPVVREVARRLRAARLRAGLSQYALASKAEMSISYVCKLENAKLAPGIDAIARLAKVLGVSIASLVANPVEQESDDEAVSKLLQQGVERLRQRDNGELTRALAVLVGALGRRT